MMSRNYEPESTGKRSRSDRTPTPTRHNINKKARSASPATSSSSKSSTPSPEDWEMFPVVLEHKEGKLYPPVNGKAKQAAESLIQEVDMNSFLPEKQKTLRRNEIMRLDYQSSNGGYSNLQIQENKITHSRSVACVLIQENFKFGKELIKTALSYSLEDQQIWRLRSTE